MPDVPKAPKGIPREHPNAASSHMEDRCVAATSLRCCGGMPGDQDVWGTNELSKIESILGTRMSQNLSRDRRRLAWPITAYTLAQVVGSIPHEMTKSSQRHQGSSEDPIDGLKDIVNLVSWLWFSMPCSSRGGIVRLMDIDARLYGGAACCVP